jgi:pyruvate dehydrogenase kinase 2/3/4
MRNPRLLLSCPGCFSDVGCLPGTLFRASQFLAEELPIRLAHRVQELETLPDGLNEMPSVKKVADWYAQSFEVRNPHRPRPRCV